MSHIPFPSTLVRMSSEAAKASLAERVNRHDRAVQRNDYEIDGIAVIRSADGKVRPAFDIYEPTCGRDEEPGLGRVLYHLKHYPNETSAYVPTVLKFESVEDLEARGVRVDHTAAALLVMSGGDPETRSHLVVADDEAGLAEIISDLGLPEDVDVRRPVIVAGEGDLNEFVASSAVGGSQIHAAANIDDLAVMLMKRFPFLDGYGDRELEGAAVISALLDHGHDIGWNVAVSARDLGHEPIHAAIVERAARDMDGPQ